MFPPHETANVGPGQPIQWGALSRLFLEVWGRGPFLPMPYPVRSIPESHLPQANLKWQRQWTRGSSSSVHIGCRSISPRWLKKYSHALFESIRSVPVHLISPHSAAGVRVYIHELSNQSPISVASRAWGSTPYHPITAWLAQLSLHHRYHPRPSRVEPKATGVCFHRAQGSHSRQNNGHHGCPHPNAQSLRVYYLKWQKGLCTCKFRMFR